MQIYLNNYRHERIQRLLTVTAAAWIVSTLAVFSTVGRMMCFALLAAIIIMTVMSLVLGSKAASDIRKDRDTVDTEKLRRMLKPAAIASVSVSIVIAAVTAIFSHNLSTPYDIAVFAGNIITPFLLVSIPFYIKALLNAAENNSTDKKYREPAERKLIRGKNAIIIIAAFVLSYAVLFYAMPLLSKTSQAYAGGQNFAKSHDITTVTEYKSEKADANTLEQLINKLPYSLYSPKTELDGQTLTVTYTGAADADIETERTVLYNATAIYALTDDLQRVIFVFGDTEYTTTRAAAVNLYDNFKNILQTSEWNTKVIYRFADDKATEEQFQILIGG